MEVTLGRKLQLKAEYSPSQEECSVIHIFLMLGSCSKSNVDILNYPYVNS